MCIGLPLAIQHELVQRRGEKEGQTHFLPVVEAEARPVGKRPYPMVIEQLSSTFDFIFVSRESFADLMHKRPYGFFL